MSAYKVTATKPSGDTMVRGSSTSDTITLLELLAPEIEGGLSDFQILATLLELSSGLRDCVEFTHKNGSTIQVERGE